MDFVLTALVIALVLGHTWYGILKPWLKNKKPEMKCCACGKGIQGLHPRNRHPVCDDCF